MAAYRFDAVLGIGLFVVLCGQPIAIAGRAQDLTGGESFSVHDTLGLAFYRAHERPLDYHLYRLANTDAKQALIRLVADKAEIPAHPTALRMLGYIADKDDIELIIKAVTGGLVGHVENDQQRDAIVAMLDCFGIMAGRGIEHAVTCLRQMADPAYWTTTPYEVTWEIPGEHPLLPHRLQGAAWAVQAYALSGRKDVPGLAAKVIEAADRPADRALLTWQLGSDNLKGQYERRIRAEKATISDFEKSYPHTLYVEHAVAFEEAKGPEAQVSKEEFAFLKTVTTEALTAYSEMRDCIVKGQVEKLKGRLLDDGQIPRADRMERLWGEAQRDLKREEVVFEALKEHNSTPGSFVVLRETTYDFPDIPAKGDIKANKVEIVSVTAKMSNSAGIGNMVFTQRPDDRTVADDGTLKVVMKKIDGKWYWNPFGW